MKIISADWQGRINPFFEHSIISFLRKIDLDGVTVVIASPFDDYSFNQKLEEIAEPWILLDYMEYGRAEPKEGHLFGRGYALPWQDKIEWHKFDEWAKRCPPLVYFKLNLSEKLKSSILSFDVFPLDYTTLAPVPEPQDKEEWEKRPFDVFYSWGYSNRERPRLHGDIIHGMVKHNYAYTDNVHYCQRWNEEYPGKKKWMALFVPHYARMPLPQLLSMQSKFKVSISMPGCGPKCFRHAESPNDCIMAIVNQDMVWSYPWENKNNCIEISFGFETHELNHILQTNTWTDDCSPVDWYRLYVNSTKTCQKYQANVYSKNYIAPIIKQYLEKQNG